MGKLRIIGWLREEAESSDADGCRDTGNKLRMAASTLERLQAIEVAARVLVQVAADNSHTLAERGHQSPAFQAAGDQWNAAYSELKTALAAGEDE